METQTLITKINGIEISAVTDENNNIFVPVKPICQAIGVQFEAQYHRMSRHYILSSVMSTMDTTGADGKTYEMVCLPVEFVYGWLFTIDASLVAEASRDNVKRYQLECYDRALQRHQREKNNINIIQRLSVLYAMRSRRRRLKRKDKFCATYRCHWSQFMDYTQERQTWHSEGVSYMYLLFHRR